MTKKFSKIVKVTPKWPKISHPVLNSAIKKKHQKELCLNNLKVIISYYYKFLKVLSGFYPEKNHLPIYLCLYSDKRRPLHLFYKTHVKLFKITKPLLRFV